MYDLWFLSYSDNDNVWYKFKERFPHARRKFPASTFEKTLNECAKESFTNMFYTVSDFVIISNDWNFNYTVDEYDASYIHIWPNIKNIFFDSDAVALWPKFLILDQYNDFDKLLENKVKKHKESAVRKYDIFFISYEEETADKNWEIFSNRFPQAKRIDKIKGIHNAHKCCASLSTTEMFYTVDADSIINDDWDFSFLPQMYDRKYLHLWYSRNPINNLEYGYGAVKLWPTNKVLEFDRPWIDFTTTVGELKIVNDTISVTQFNTSEYSAWKSAFRECIKLNENIKKNKEDYESVVRLKSWQTIFNDVPFSDWAKKGVIDSLEWIKTSDNVEKINDFDWLRTYFNKLYPELIEQGAVKK